VSENTKKLYTFQGKAHYCHPFTKDKYDKYGLKFYPIDGETRRAIKATGIRNNAKEDEDGFYYQLINKQSEIEVCDADGNEWDRQKLIGNGTDVTIELLVETFESRPRGTPGTKEYYPGGPVTRGTVTRIRVEKLVPYEKPQETSSPEETAVARGASAPVASGSVPF
jgi:hypothetical protein